MGRPTWIKPHHGIHESGRVDSFHTTSIIEAAVKRVLEFSHVILNLGFVGDGQYLKRVGTDIVGADVEPPTPGDSDYAGKFESATIGDGDIPDGKWGWWWDTRLLKMMLVRNRGGALFAVELTQL